MAAIYLILLVATAIVGVASLAFTLEKVDDKFTGNSFKYYVIFTTVDILGTFVLVCLLGLLGYLFSQAVKGGVVC